MKHIIKPGTKFIATCHQCGCVFSYEREDIVREVWRNEAQSWVNCPQCNIGIRVDYTYGNVIKNNGNVATKE